MQISHVLISTLVHLTHKLIIGVYLKALQVSENELLKSFINERFVSLANSPFCCRRGLQSMAVFSLVCSERTPQLGTRPDFDPGLFIVFNWITSDFNWLSGKLSLSFHSSVSAQLLRGKTWGNNPYLHWHLTCYLASPGTLKSGRISPISSHCWAQRCTPTSLHYVCVFRGLWSVLLTNCLWVQSTHKGLCKDYNAVVQYSRVDPSQSHEANSSLICRAPSWPSPAFIYGHKALMRLHACDQSQSLGCSNGEFWANHDQFLRQTDHNAPVGSSQCLEQDLAVHARAFTKLFGTTWCTAFLSEAW